MGREFSLLLILCGAAVLLAILVAVIRHTSKKSAIAPGVAILAYLAAALLAGMTLWVLTVSSESPAPPTVPTAAPTSGSTEATSQQQTAAPTEMTEPTATEAPILPFAPAQTANSDPANWGVEWEIIENDTIVESYTRANAISFGDGSDYFALPGIATFRGNNYRDSASYGTADVTEESLDILWSHPIGSFNGWGGCAWTGQPLVVQWDAEAKSIMNLYDSKKEKEDLVEVIYATLDGNIHFYDLEDGSQTRDPIYMGANFKGAGALDPRGYPILYVGSGIPAGKSPRMYIVSLIDGSILYEYGNNDPFDRRKWTAFDSSPLVDAETDTLIWPGENGILYTIHLNTAYDPAAGTISVSPDDMVKIRYRSDYSRAGRYYGFESSVSIVDHYLYVSENGGMFYCIDLNAMALVWAQDTKDDSNSSPVFEWGEDGNGYIYTAPSLHWTASGGKGSVSIYKLDAQTGEILWEHAYDCRTVTDVSGGVQATPVLGKEGTDIEGMVIYAVARTPSTYDGVLVALDTETGEVIWEVDTKNYSWSSPAAVYTEEGKAYILTCNASGKIRFIDGATGEILDELGLTGTTEASPVVFGNIMVLGTREKVYGVKIS